MSKLADILPPPTIRVITQPPSRVAAPAVNISSTALVSTAIPPYSQRTSHNFALPKSDEGFNDGGAYPELHIPQYPHGVGRPQSRNSNALALQLDEDGNIRYDVLLRQGMNDSKKIIYYKHQDLMPKPIGNENDPELQRPDAESLRKLTLDTIAEVNALTEQKLNDSLPIRRAEERRSDQFIRYTPSDQNHRHNAGAEQRIIRMVETQKDPMEPPKFKISQKIPRPPPSPPAPVMHSPPRKLTAQDQTDWKIPPCISNWKNPKGFTIPLDKRLAADGRGLQTVQINENFPKLAEALYLGEREARKAVEMRAQLERKLAQREKEKKEEMLRNLAAKARDERAAGVTGGAAVSLQTAASAAGIPLHRGGTGNDADDLREALAGDDDDAGGGDSNNADEAERNDLRRQVTNERRRERNLARAAPDRRQKILQRDAERDISEKIALNMPLKNATVAGGALETQYDERLFGQSKGLESGFNAGEDDTYAVYDKPWRSEKELASALYKPTRDKDHDVYNDAQLDELIKTNRFVPDRGFAGAGTAAGAGGGAVRREGPVQFEKRGEEGRRTAATRTQQDAVEEDPFGLDKFLAEAKQGGGAGAAGKSNRNASERDNQVSSTSAGSKRQRNENADRGGDRGDRDDRRGGGDRREQSPPDERLVDEYERRRKHKR